ncbi:MAG: SusC/RagA family TonB-linked outer membrane protein [Saprospiraceae bacterium]
MKVNFLRKIFFIILLCGISNYTFAQFKISGSVKDAVTQEALIGASILIKSSTSGTVTDIDGNFSLDLKSGKEILVVTYTGYEPLEIFVENRQQIDILLKTDSRILNEVVVIGYGTVKKSDLTGAVGSVKSKELSQLPTASVEQALQGRVAGVQVTPVSGEPGAGAIVRIRGIGTLNNASPIYVVDGLILDDIKTLNVNDIESIEILKDASATAIYGSRGANGVVMITTKKGGTDGKVKFSLSSYTGTQQVIRKIKMADASQFAQMYNEYIGNTKTFPNPAALGKGTDWQDVIFQSAPIRNLMLSASGGTEKSTFSLSAGYFKQNGIIIGSDFEQLNLRLNANYNLSRFLKVGHNLNIARSNSQFAPNVLMGAYRMPPVFTPKDSSGKYSDPTFFGTAIGNPAASLEYTQNEGKGTRLMGDVYAEVQLLKDLKFRSSFGGDLQGNQNRNYEGVYKVSSSQLRTQDFLSLGIGKSQYWQWENTLSYNKAFNKNHVINAVAGYTSQEWSSEFLYSSREKLIGNSKELLYIDAGDKTTSVNGGGGSAWAIISYLARVNYTLFDRYLLTASIRRDGSSRFGANNRYGNFPSLAVGWNIANEPFMQNQEIFDRIKLRASWGIVGNDKTVVYPGIAVINAGNFAVFGAPEKLNSAATLTAIANPNVKWEQTSQTDIGLDFGILKGSLTAEVDYYRRITDGILLDVPIPAYVGSTSNPIVNAAKVQNEGFDFTLNWRKGERFKYNISLNASNVRNKVLELGQGKEAIFGGDIGEGAKLGTRTTVGSGIGDFYGYKVVGVFQNADEIKNSPNQGNEKPGDLKFADLNSYDSKGKLTGIPDGKIDPADRTYLGTPIPKWIFGANIGLEYAGFDFSAFLNGQKGNSIINAKAMSRFAVYNWEHTFFENRWTGEGTSNTNPRVTSQGRNYQVSDYFVQDASFLRLRTLQLGYTLPENLANKIKLSKFRVYATATNLWTLQKFTGYTPEISNTNFRQRYSTEGFTGNVLDSNIDRGTYPLSKSWIFGIDLNF